MRTPREVIEEWVAAFNYRDSLRAAALYHEDATNWQVAAGEPMVGRARIKEDLTSFFSAFPDNSTRIENLFEDGEWAILEWFGGT
jgi:ketosteroid isomerase-like protein